MNYDGPDQSSFSTSLGLVLILLTWVLIRPFKWLKFNFVNKQVKKEGGKTPHGEELPRYKFSESNICFEGSIAP